MADGLDLMLAPTDGRPYLFSTLPPERLSHRYRGWAGGHLIAFWLAVRRFGGWAQEGAV